MIKKEFIKNIKKNLKKIEDETLYSTNDVFELEIIFTINGEQSKQRVCRELRKLPRKNMGTDTQPRYFVSGKTLREYVETRYISKFNK